MGHRRQKRQKLHVSQHRLPREMPALVEPLQRGSIQSAVKSETRGPLQSMLVLL
jgi:hypothetical protein